MKVVKKGCKVSIVSQATLEDGTLCFKNSKDDPIEFVVGEGKFFPAIEQKIQDMKEGETKTIPLEPEEMFGPYVNDLILELPKTVMKPTPDITVGSRVRIETQAGKTFFGTIAEIKDETIRVDFNHPLAGKKILYTLTILSIADL
jgi:FKBP-type peptidyl-prolyl cis-trans isomerase 2